MQQLDYLSTDIERYIQDHYENRQVRAMLISDAFQENDYPKAVKLLRDSQAIDDDKDYCQQDYSTKLIHAYQGLGTMMGTNRPCGNVSSISTSTRWKISWP